MWCTNCQQDVPGIAHAATGRMVCSRCQRAHHAKKPPQPARICDEGIALDEPVAAAVAAAPPVRADDWSNRQRVRNLGRELRRPGIGPAAFSPSPMHGPHRLDPPHGLFDQLERITTPNLAPTMPSQTSTAALRARRAEGKQILAWLVVTLGAIGLVASIGLIAWSIVNRQMMYWNVALGLALGSQGVLIFGFVLVVARLWRSSRYAGGKLQDVHARLAQLQHTADALAVTRPGGGPGFYADLVRGASPQVLLANLKGQVDQLAMHLAGRW